MIQGKGFSNQNGTSGESIYGKKFEDKSCYYKHDQRVYGPWQIQAVIQIVLSSLSQQFQLHV